MILYEEPRFLWSGDACLVVEFGDGIDRGINELVHQCRRVLQSGKPDWLIDSVPTYRSLAVFMDPAVTDRSAVVEYLRGCLPDPSTPFSEAEGDLVEVPVCYGGEFGPDLGTVASHTGYAQDEVIRRHCEAEYYVYMLGFTPGFTYLGGLDPTLETPRLKEPRISIPAGSVGIAGRQTGIYPIASPGGWQLIGRTPLVLFDPAREPAVLVNAGMRLRFVPITEERYHEFRSGVEK